MVKVAINGLGRIGRAALKIVLDTPELELVAANDIASPENLACLLKYDTVYGRYERPVASDENGLIIAGTTYRLFREKDPARLPWGTLGIDIVLEYAKKKRVAIMCSEAVWWRCHRALIADYLKSIGIDVYHIMSMTSNQLHPYTSAARIRDGKLFYYE